MDIPVFHDDQHGTAIISAAGLVNALHLTGRDIKKTKLVVNGAGAAGIACVELAKAIGISHENVLLCDTKGVIYKGRTEGMNQWKSAHAVQTDARSLADALKGADVVYGLSVKGAFSREMILSMAKDPIIFAMANPDPEITPEEVAGIRSDAIIATGRSDYANQVNNVIGFPYIFRGALDVRARSINMEMKVAAVHAIAQLAREDVPDEVAAAYQGSRPRFGRDYIIPAPFDPRLISTIPCAVAKAAMDSGVARRNIDDMDAYKAELHARRDPVSGALNGVFESVRKAKRKVVFAEGEEEQVLRAAISYVNQGLGSAVLIGRESQILETAELAGIDLKGRDGIEIMNTKKSTRIDVYFEYLYQRLQRQGFLKRDVVRLLAQDRNTLAACMVALGDADAMVTGVTRKTSKALEAVERVIDKHPSRRVIGVSLCISRGQVVVVADTAIHERPTGEELADIAIEAAAVARRFGYTPRVAMLASGSFGHPVTELGDAQRKAVRILSERNVDFEFDGEMTASVALNKDLLAQYPFTRLTGPANVLVMPAAHSAAIATSMLQELGGAMVLGPMITGLARPVQLVPLNATDTDIVNMAALAAFDIGK